MLGRAGGQAKSSREAELSAGRCADTSVQVGQEALRAEPVPGGRILGHRLCGEKQLSCN